MDPIDELARSIKRRVEQARQVQLRYVECLDVDWKLKAMTAKGTADDTEYLDVRLGLGATNVKPAKGSLCLIGLVEGLEVSTFLISAGEIELIETKANEIIYNDGGNEGFVKVKETVARLNAIESDLNTLKSVFQSWITVPEDGGAALKAAAATWFGQQLALTEQDDIENDKIKH